MTVQTDHPDLGEGWDWLQLTIPVNRADTDIEQVAHEAADAARAALTSNLLGG